MTGCRRVQPQQMKGSEPGSGYPADGSVTCFLAQGSAGGDVPAPGELMLPARPAAVLLWWDCSKALGQDRGFRKKCDIPFSFFFFFFRLAGEV